MKKPTSKDAHNQPQFFLVLQTGPKPAQILILIKNSETFPKVYRGFRIIKNIVKQSPHLPRFLRSWHVPADQIFFSFSEAR